MRSARQVAARRWLVALTLPGLALLGAAGWLALQLGAVQVGLFQAGRQDHAAAADSFDLARRVSVVERWVAPFDLGTAQYRLAEWDAAAASFEEAAGHAPATAQCRIRLNWAWSLEAGADALADGADPLGAIARLQQAQFILSTAPCGADQAAPDDEEGRSGELEGQWNQTRQRIETKSDRTEAPEAPEEPTDTPDNTEQLAERQLQAQQQRQIVQDQQTRAEPSDGEKTW